MPNNNFENEMASDIILWICDNIIVMALGLTQGQSQLCTQFVL